MDRSQSCILQEPAIDTLIEIEAFLATVGDRNTDLGGLRSGPEWPDQGRLRAAQVLVPALQHAAEWGGLAIGQRHGGQQPAPPRLHLHQVQAGHRGHRLPVELHGRKPMYASILIVLLLLIY